MSATQSIVDSHWLLFRLSDRLGNSSNMISEVCWTNSGKLNKLKNKYTPCTY